MPILERDVDVWPTDLLSRDTTDLDEWHALYTRPRHEKVLMRHLKAQGKEFCGLLVPRQHRFKSRNVTTSFLPLFPNYVFLRGNAHDRADAMRTNCVCHTLEVPDGVGLQQDLRRIEAAIQAGHAITVESQFQPGTEIRIKSGPFSGQEGVLVQRRGQTRLVLTVSFLQQAVSVELDECSVEPI